VKGATVLSIWTKIVLKEDAGRYGWKDPDHGVLLVGITAQHKERLVNVEMTLQELV